MSGLAVVTAVRDRPVPLRASLAAWSADAAVDEIVVVDWGSEVPLARVGVLDFPKVVLVTAGQGEPWLRGLALNLGIEAAAGALVLCLDPGMAHRDAGPDAALVHERGGFSSECGPDATAVLVARADLRAVGGWHEFLPGEGFAAQDLYNRLEDAGVVRRFFREDVVGPVPCPDHVAPPIRSPDEIRIELPGGMARDPFFASERNKLLAGLAPWNAVLASLRPRRMGRPAPREVTVQLGPRTALERRLQDVASYLTARFIAQVPEEISMPMFAEMIDDRSPGDRTRGRTGSTRSTRRWRNWPGEAPAAGGRGLRGRARAAAGAHGGWRARACWPPRRCATRTASSASWPR